MAQEISLMTYNIRYDNPRDGVNRWDNRKDFLTKQVLFHEPDVMGVQEALHHQVKYIDEALIDYSYVGVGRDGKEKGEYSALFFKKSFEVLDQGTFWLSETPEKISVGWDASMERICTYAKLRRGEDILWVFNTHFDHIGQKAREESAALIIQMIERKTNLSENVVLMGDLNLQPTSEPIQYLATKMEDTYNSPISFGPDGTFNGFDISKPVTRRIDYIFVGGLNLIKYAVLSDNEDLRFPSDHLPVIAIVAFK